MKINTTIMTKKLFIPALFSALFFLSNCKKDEAFLPEEIEDETTTISSDSLTRLSLAPSEVAFVDASVYGAIPNDNISDKKAINNAVLAAFSKGIKEVRLKPGTYIIDNSIVLKSNVIINGLDKTKTKIMGSASNHTGFGFVQFIGIKNAGLKNLTLDGNAVIRKTTGGNGAVFFTGGSSYNTLENLTITNFASPTRMANYITISANENTGSGSSYNKILNCELIDANGYSEFGIRFWTDWNEAKSSNSFKNLVSNNVIEGCTLTGFVWNAIELAGPGTVHNKVTKCKVMNSKANSAFDLDKGASYNELTGNIVENLGGNTVEATYAYRSQGLIRSTYDRPAVGNKFYNNKATNIRNTSSSSKSGAVLMYHSVDAEVVGNNFSNIKYGSTSNVSGIWINGVKNLKIKDNVIEKVTYGIYVIGGSNNYQVSISNNTFSYVSTVYKSFATGVKSAFTFVENIFPQSSIIKSTNETLSRILK